MTLNTAASRYYAEVAQAQPSAEWTDYLLESCLDLIGSATALPDIDDETLADMVARLRARVSNATSNRHVELMRRLLRRAGRIWNVAVPEIDWSAHLLEEPHERIRELTAAEEARLFAALRQDYHPIVRFCLITGVRRDNAVTLAWEQVDFDAGLITFRIKSTKPGGKAHTIPITSTLRALLARERGNHETRVFTYKAVRTWDGKIRGQRYPVSVDSLKRVWRTALTNAKVKDFRFHDLRHTAATRLQRANHDLNLTKRMLGHRSIASTARYAHASDEDLRAAMERTETPPAPADQEKKGSQS